MKFPNKIKRLIISLKDDTTVEITHKLKAGAMN